MRVLLTGASGLLGGRLCQILAADHEVWVTRHRTAPALGLPSVPLDLEQEASIRAAVEEARPDAVVHAAALADAAACEAAPERALRINRLGTALVAEACARAGARLVFLSTDLVFDGQAGGREEAHAPGPLTVYGRSKLEAEGESQRRCPGAAVLRVALVCGGGHGPRASASEAVAWALRRGERVRLYTDEHRTPVDAEALGQALRGLLAGRGEGVYHLGGAERVSRLELGLRTAAVLGLPASGIEPASRKSQTGPPRPADVSLDSGRARRELGYAPRALEAMIRGGRPHPPPV